MITVQETTKWDVPTPNHKYIMSDNLQFAYAYIKVGERRPFIFSQPMRIDWRGRSYKILVKTKDVDPNTKTWKIAGSKGNQYMVSLMDNQYRCTCPSSTFRRGQCKHIESVINGTTNQSR